MPLKMLKKSKNKFVFFFFFLLSSCGTGEKEIPKVTHIDVDFSMIRLEKLLFDMNKKELKEWFSKNENIGKYYFGLNTSPLDSVIMENILSFKKKPYNNTLLRDVEENYKDFLSVKEEIIQLFQFIKYYYPNFVIPEVYTFVSGYGSYGFGKDLYYNGTHLIIGLDFFSGENTSLKPSIPHYILKRMNKQYLTSSIALLISQEFNKYKEEDNTLLADMLYFGKAYYFVSKVLPSAPDSVIIGYSGEELEECQQYMGVIWKHFIDEQLFFKTDTYTKNKYLAERPNVVEIGHLCPGRVGRWLGWKIIKKYQQDYPTPFTHLLSMSDMQIIFEKAKFRP